MIEIKNLRIEGSGEWTRVIADIESDEKRTDKESTMWVAVKNENAAMLTSDVYNMFLFLPLYMSMYYHTDLRLHGNVSKRLYRNMKDYVEPILTSFSSKLSYSNIFVNGFSEADGKRQIIGTGISCGVDCLSTIYKYSELENDPDYKLNALFMLNCGWHGDFYDTKSNEVFYQRCLKNMCAAADIGITFIEVDSNLHAFLPQLGDQCSYFAIYTCIFAMEKAIKRYYISSSFSYSEVMKYGIKAQNRDFSEYADPLALPLMRSEVLELVNDGCQYTRSQKTAFISDWEISKKYLNVCCINDSTENCSVCHKCLRTLIPLDAMGKLQEYAGVFKLEAYRKKRLWALSFMVHQNKRDGFATDNYIFCKEKRMKLPCVLYAKFYIFPRMLPKYIRKAVKMVKGKLTK